MNIYLASRFSRLMELRGYKKQIEELGHKVVSRWLNEDPEQTFEKCSDEKRADVAQRDLRDVWGAEMFIGFNEEPRTPTNGGRLVELGFALDVIPCWIVGPRENVFHYLPSIRHFETWEQALAKLKEA